MLRTFLKTAVTAACLSAMLFGFGTTSAEAGWRWHGSNGGSSGGSSGGWSGGSSGGYGNWGGGSSGGYGSWNTWGWGSSGGSWGGYGSNGGFLRRWHARHHGSSGGYGSSGGWSNGSSGGWGNGSSGGWNGSSGGSSGGGVIYSESGYPADGAIETNRPPMPPPPGGPNAPPVAEPMTMNRQTDAMLTVTLPEDAKVYVNGKLTKSQGGERHYISRGLTAGNTYTYEVKAIVEREGREIEEVKTVKLHAGDITEIAMEVQEIINPVTTLKVTVPEDAKVLLSGNETTSTGIVRTFSSKTLAEGQAWKNYTITVVTQRDGQPLTLEKTITLKAGDNAHVEFDFDRNEAIADAR